ncbi:MAG: PH domain-containing protein [Acidobacteriota bacterium]|nr:PH domain-containing protein [Acidobacteriota bacterium]
MLDFMNNDWRSHLKPGDRSVAHTQTAEKMCWVKAVAAALPLAACAAFLCVQLIGLHAAIFPAASVMNEFDHSATGDLSPRPAEEFASTSPTDTPSRGIPLFLVFSLVAVPLFTASFRSFHFVLTQSGVYSIGGLLFKHSRFVPYGRITDAEVRRGLLSQLIDTASIGISTAGGTRSARGNSSPFEITISEVVDYREIRRAILQKVA